MMKRNLSKEKKIARLNRIGERSRIQGEKITPPSAHNIAAEAELTEVLIKEENMQKLILDQPERVTNEGTVETFIGNVQLNEIENDPLNKKKNVLITEDPMEGIQIILND